jgi:hypothetical protein
MPTVEDKDISKRVYLSVGFQFFIMTLIVQHIEALRAFSRYLHILTLSTAVTMLDFLLLVHVFGCSSCIVEPSCDPSMLPDLQLRQYAAHAA